MTAPAVRAPSLLLLKLFELDRDRNGDILLGRIYATAVGAYGYGMSCGLIV